MKSNKAALKTFEAFSNSNKKEYIEWITETKTEATREKRMDTALEWMAEGKIRNWKYLKT
ncbi:MAG: YdeI/OmpD-associated family protein [Cytophagales bacterium]|nr:YdeI/OmpD-associated family protein [Cytophagales bacterium]